MGNSGDTWRFGRELEEILLPEPPACRAGCSCWVPARWPTVNTSSFPSSSVLLATTGQLDRRLVPAQGQDLIQASVGCWCRVESVLDGCSDMGLFIRGRGFILGETWCPALGRTLAFFFLTAFCVELGGHGTPSLPCYHVHILDRNLGD